MADRAEIKITLDARQAKGEARRARKQLTENNRRVRDVLRRERKGRAQLAEVAAVGAAARGGIGSIGAAAIGLGGRALFDKFRTGKGGFIDTSLARGANFVGSAAFALGVFEGVSELGALSAEIFNETLIKPLVSAVLRDVLPEVLPGFIRKEFVDRFERQIQDRIREGIDEFRKVTRFEAITKQFARAQLIGVAVAFERAGQGFTASQGANLSENFVREAERRNFLRRVEASRTTSAVAKAVAERITKAFGE